MLGVVELAVVDVDVELMVVDAEVELMVVVAEVDGAAAGLGLEQAAAKTASPTKTTAPALIDPPRLPTWSRVAKGAAHALLVSGSVARRSSCAFAESVVRAECHIRVHPGVTRGSRSRASRAGKTLSFFAAFGKGIVNHGHPRNISSPQSRPSGFRNETESRRLAKARSARGTNTVAHGYVRSRAGPRRVCMLVVGTTVHLEDLDRSYTYAEDVSVTALAVGSFSGGVGSLLPSAARSVWSILDRERIVSLEEFDVTPLVRLPTATAQSLAVSPAGSLVVGMQGAHLLTVSPDGAIGELGSFDTVAGRDEWQNPAGPVPDLRSIAVSSADVWFAGVHVGGVWRSKDRGQSWQSVIPPEADVHEVVAGDGDCVAVAAAVGFGWSQDSGDTWQWTTDGLHAGYSRAVAIDGDSAFVTVSTGPETTDGRLYRCRLGDRFEPCSGGLPESFPFNLDTGSIAASAGRVALGTRDGLVFLSSDNGSTWSLAADRMRHVTNLRFA